MWYQKLEKFEIAKEQLHHAIELFCANERLISAITLAGAAEEILGRLVSKSGVTNSLESDVNLKAEITKDYFGGGIEPKIFITQANYARNELKHLSSGDPIEIDIEQELINLIDRAIENYKTLDPSHNPTFVKFDDKAAAWWKNREEQLMR